MEKLSTSEPSPLSPTRWTPDAFAWPRSLAALAILIAALGAGLVLASIITLPLGIRQGGALTLSWGIIIAQLVSYVPVVAALVVVLPWAAGRSLRDLGLRALDRRATITGIVGALVMYAVTDGLASLQYAITREKPSEASTTLFAGAHDPLLALGFVVFGVAIAPFVEELTFRGFLFNALLRYTPVWFAAAVSGALFGLSHGSATAFLPLAGSGVVLAYVYYRTGSLAASMLTHGLFNAINFALLTIGAST